MGAALADDEAPQDFTAIEGVITTCEVCHGAGGASVQQQYPILAGQEFYYLYVQLKDFKSGLRADPIMGPLASALDKETMQLVATYFSQQTWPATNYIAGEQQIVVGRTVVVAGQCVACHLGAFHGNSRVPRLAGQHPDYLAKTMLDFKTKARKNSPAKGSLMASFDDQDIVDAACYLSGLRD
jgi:cytochrome c553